MHINAHLVEAAAHTPAVSLHIDNMPSGGGAPGAGSIDATKLAANAVETAKIKDGAVTDAKLASDAVGEGNIKNGAVSKAKLAGGVLPANATKEAPGLVKQAAKVDDCADNNADHLKTTLNGLLAALREAGVLATS